MYDRARLAILNQLCAFSLQQEISGRGYPTNRGHRFDLESKPVIGDLVALSGGRMNTAFYLSWVEQIGGEGVEGHLLRSVDDGSLRDWTNVGFMVLDRGWVAENPHWRWSDEQFALNDRWAGIFSAECLAATYRRRPVRFEGEGCTLVAERASGGNFTRFFESWRALDDIALTEAAREAKEQLRLRA